MARPTSRSMNSRTSRPRSPTRQMTLMSAVVERAIMPSSDDLPTPEPAKMPRRWPRPQGTMPSSAPSGMSSVRRERKPTTSAGTGARPRPVAISQTSPTSASRPVASTISPIRSDTRPCRRCRSARAIAAVRRCSRDSAIGELVLEHLACPGELGLERRVDLALGGAHDGPARAHAALGLDLAVLDATELADEARRVLAHDVEVLGVDEDQDAITLDQPAQRAAHDLDHELAVDRERGAERLLGDAQRQLDGLGLDRGGGVGAQVLKLLGGGGQRGGRALEPGLRGRMRGGEAFV